MSADENLSMLIAAEVRKLLFLRDMTMTQLGERAGMTQPYISRRLTGATTLDVDDLQRIAEALEVDVSALLPAPAYRDERGQSPPRRNTLSSSAPTERAMRSTHTVTAGHTHGGDGRTAGDSSGDQPRRPAIRSYRHEQVTPQ